MTYEIHRAAVAKLLFGRTLYPDMVPIHGELAYRAQMVRDTARMKAGKSTGRMAAATLVEERMEPPFWRFIIEAHTPYSYYHHRGTKPHVIKGKPTLRFRRGAVMVHATSVSHPGTAPNPFLRDSLSAFMRAPESPKFRTLDRTRVGWHA